MTVLFYEFVDRSKFVLYIIADDMTSVIFCSIHGTAFITILQTKNKDPQIMKWYLLHPDQSFVFQNSTRRKRWYYLSNWELLSYCYLSNSQLLK